MLLEVQGIQSNCQGFKGSFIGGLFELKTFDSPKKPPLRSLRLAEAPAFAGRSLARGPGAAQRLRGCTANGRGATGDEWMGRWVGQVGWIGFVLV